MKMGTYGFLRFAIPLFPSAAIDFTPWIMGLSVIGIVYGSLVAMVQADIKKLVAYSSVAHLGFVMLGMFALNVHGLSGRYPGSLIYELGSQRSATRRASSTACTGTF